MTAPRSNCLSRDPRVQIIELSLNFYFVSFRSAVDSNLSSELTEVYNQLQNIESDKAPSKASIILSGLGFSPTMQQKPTKTFSGGWRMRLALARALFSR